jgi:hypothetical protein
MTRLITPDGYEQVTATFGDCNAPGFQARNIISQVLPYPMRYRDDETKPWVTITRVQIHHLIASPLVAALTAVWTHARMEVKKVHGYALTTEEYDDITHAWLRNLRLDEYGGAFVQRTIRGSSHPSLHSWGIAIDISPELYPLGSLSRMPDWFVAAFTGQGFFYGGDFGGRKDPQHFQFATGC